MNPWSFGRKHLERWRNTAFARGKRPYSALYYIVEPADWSTRWDGQYITGNLNRQALLPAKVATEHHGVHNQILHFGSRNLFLPDAWKKVDASNKVVMTWFHGTEQEENPEAMAMIKALPAAAEKVMTIHTTCAISAENLAGWGVPPQKIVVLPLGVDLDIFTPVDDAAKEIVRRDLGLPRDSVIIGSFQKDGAGWGEGTEPKWVKGPDVFIRVVERLKMDYNVYVLLTGPARGYVKKNLERIRVPYRHFYLKDYREIPKYYRTLDLYLVTSRAEGGPKAVLEAMACGVPLVSTRVGMAADIVRDGVNGRLAEIDDADSLAAGAAGVISDHSLAEKLRSGGLETAGHYSWKQIARRYYEEIYRPLQVAR